MRLLRAASVVFNVSMEQLVELESAASKVRLGN